MTTTATTAPELVLTYVRVAAIAEHPDNPRRELKNIDELAASMQTNGLLQPVVVVPMEAFLAARPDDGVRIQAAAGLEYVTVIGHRRTAAAEKLEWETIPAIVRPDLASAQAAARTFIVENLQRVDLDPIEEARGYTDLARLGLSQRQIAEECGKSQPHVSKRLALLQLPEAAQEAVAGGEVKLADAVKLAALPVEAREEAWTAFEREAFDRDLAWSVQDAEEKLAAARRLEENRQKAADEGVELIDPQQAFGRKSWEHRLYDNKKEIAKARKAGTLRASVSSYGLDYYTTIPRESAHTATADRTAAELKKAAKNRTAALQRLVAKPPVFKDLLAELAAAVVNNEATGSEAAKLAKAWLPISRFPAPADNSVYTWQRAIGEDDWPWLAWTLSVAATEQACRASYLTWGPRQAAHVQRLIDRAGYEPTEWEAEQLDRIRRHAAEQEARTNERAAEMAETGVAAELRADVDQDVAGDELRAS